MIFSDLVSSMMATKVPDLPLACLLVTIVYNSVRDSGVSSMNKKGPIFGSIQVLFERCPYVPSSTLAKLVSIVPSQFFPADAVRRTIRWRTCRSRPPVMFNQRLKTDLFEISNFSVSFPLLNK